MAPTLSDPIVLSSSSPARLLDSHDQLGEIPHIQWTGVRRQSTTPLHLETLHSEDALRLSGRQALANVDVNAGIEQLSQNVSAPQARDRANSASTGIENAREQAVSDAKQSSPVASKTGVKRKRAVKAVPDAKPATKPRKRSTKATTGDDLPDVADGREVPAPAKKRAAKKKAPTNSGLAGQSVKATEEVSHHFGQTKPGPDSNTPGKLSDDTPELGLTKALSRRRSWTPVASQELPPSNQQASDGSQAIEAAQSAFRQAVHSFSYDQPDAAEGQAEAPAAKASTRKRKVEAGDGIKAKPAVKRKPAAPKAQKEPKALKPVKAPKPPKQPKVVRPKTVTDYAIAAYRKPVEDAAPPGPTVTTFFKPTDTQTVAVDDSVALLDPKPKGPIASKIFSTTLEFQFPAPEKALKNMRKQDFLFGTSSQLAKDDSPRTHRIMQQVLQESEEMAFASQSASIDLERSPRTSRAQVACAPHGTSLTVGPGASNLWTVAARDSETKMFASTPRQARDGRAFSSSPPKMHDVVPVDERLAQGGTTAADAPAAEEEDDPRHDSGFVDLSEAEKADQVETTEAEHNASHGKPNDVTRSIPVSGVSSGLHVLEITSSPPDDSLASLAGVPIKAKVSAARSKASKEKASEVEVEMDLVPKRPRGRPRKEVSAAATTALGAAATTPSSKAKQKAKGKAASPVQQAKAPTTPKRAGKTAKSKAGATASSWADIDEISDSEPGGATPSPPRRLASVPNSPKALDLSPDPSKHLPSNAIESAEHGNEELGDDKANVARLFAVITRLIKSAPRSRDLTRPSWYEKMLLYDPIVLEDLTAWLVEQGVRADGTVGEKPVVPVIPVVEAGQEPEKEKESKGKKGKGKGRAKATDDNGAGHAAQTRDVLQPQMVQKWCESNSVCCLWKAGLRGGVRAKY